MTFSEQFFTSDPLSKDFMAKHWIDFDSSEKSVENLIPWKRSLVYCDPSDIFD
jgi:hypothetical protein